MKTISSLEAERQTFIQALNIRLLTSHSATLVLEKWCAEYAVAASPSISARRIISIDKPATAEQRARLSLGQKDKIRYRRVQLFCGNILLSEADNWYVSTRLTPKMNQRLDNTDIPFGRVVQSLRPTRRNLAVNFPNPADVPTQILEHRALLMTPSNQPLAEVAETYFSAVLPPHQKANAPA